VRLGQAGGGFSAPLLYPAGLNPRGVAVGDFNGDGQPDVAVANAGSHDVSVLLNDGNWPPADAPTIRVGDVTVTEGHAGTVNATFTVTLSAAYHQVVTVDYLTSDSGATAGSDYQAASGTLTFAPGETEKTISIAVLGDQLFEPNETFTVSLTNPTGALIADGTGIGTIVNDDSSLPRITISDVARVEGRNGKTLVVFTVTLSAPSATPVKVNYVTADGTARAGEDYEAATGTLTFAPGETTKTLTIKVKGDQKKEADETFFVDLFGSSSNSLLLNSRGIGTILNDD
jgi:chitinase